jgi:hypothetical protein
MAGFSAKLAEMTISGDDLAKVEKSSPPFAVIFSAAN